MMADVISSRNSPKGWKRPFDEPIPLPRGRQAGANARRRADFLPSWPSIAAAKALPAFSAPDEESSVYCLTFLNASEPVSPIFLSFLTTFRRYRSLCLVSHSQHHS
jgi:hypothetical protein